MKSRILMMLLIGLTVSSCKSELTYDMDAPLPLDSNYRIGELDNGMKYYIRNNNEPKDVANFYFMQKAGALLEEDNQNGLAHFLEHMAFNGTKNFPEKRIIKMLEAHGVEFGRDINAFTALDKTIYNLNNIPVAEESLLDSCLLVLHDWSNYLNLDPDEIDAERGVIVEEWRQQEGLSTRLRKQTMPVIMEGSKYAERDVIGDMDIIRNFKREALVDFYHKWYRTDMQAVAVVGAIDVDAMEQKIIKMFSEIPANENPTPIPEFKLSPRSDCGYVCATDRDAVQSTIQIYSINENPSPVPVTHGYIKELYIQAFYNQMLGERISEMIRKGSDSINGGSAAFGQFLDGYSSYSITVDAKPNMGSEALESLYSEVERARRYGFNKSELERAKSSSIVALDNAYKKRDKINSDSYADEISGIFLDNDTAVDIEYYTPFAKYVIESITIDDINKAAWEYVTKNNRVIVVSGPEKGVKLATKEEVLAAMDRVEQSELVRYYDDIVGLELVGEEHELKGSEVDKVEKLGMFGAEKWTLENGVNVIFAKADYDKNSVTLQATSDGGSSILPREDLLAASITGDIVKGFGLGELDPTILRKYMAGKSAGVGVHIGELQESVVGASTTDDFETMLQMVYLTFEQPRFDELQFKNIISRSATSYDMYRGTPDQIMQDSLRLLFSNYNSRSIDVTGDKLRALKLEEIEAIYRDRIKDSGDFTFYIVGDVEKSDAKPLIEKYIGSITCGDRDEEWVDNNVTIAKGHTERMIGINFQTPKANVISYVTTSFEEYSRKLSYETTILRDVLDQRFITNIREKESGTYGVSARASISDRPRNELDFTIQFECNPELAAHLKALVDKELKNIKETQITQDELSGVKKSIIKSLKKRADHNNFVMLGLINWEQDKLDTSDIQETIELVESITRDDIQKLANMIFNEESDRLDVTFASKK